LEKQDAGLCRVSAILSGSSTGLPENTFFLAGAACFFCAALSGIGNTFQGNITPKDT
jgi:hypothetical protein